MFGVSSTDLKNLAEVNAARNPVTEQTELRPQEVAAEMDRIYARGDRIVTRFLLLHALIAAGLSFFYDTWLITGVLTFCSLAMFVVALKLVPGTTLARCIGGLSLQIFVALHIYQMHGLAEMHFFFFTGLTVMLVYQDWKCLWPGALFIVGQHLAFAVMHNTGVRVYFFEQSYVGVSKLAFHFGIAIAHAGICSVWAHLLRQQALASALQHRRMHAVNDRLRAEMVERQRTEVALRGAKEDAERANLAKSEFLSRMSHELRTPLNAILGFGQILEMDHLSDDQGQSVRHILKGGHHLLTLINEVLDIAKIESGELGFSLESVALQPLVADVAMLIAPLAKARRIQLSVSPTVDGRCHVYADMQRLKQVLLNLLSNAIKYNCDDGVVEVACEHYESPATAETPAARRIRLAVRDTGPGISPSNLPKLFTPFERLGAERMDIEGSGIGLALCKHLIEAMGGRIGVHSVHGVGSTFYFEMPVAISPDEMSVSLTERTEEPAAAVEEFEALGARKTILHIEDNSANRHVIEKVIARRSHVQLITAIQGQIGLELARQHRPDLILLDLHLPDMPGADVLARLHSDPKTCGIPVVVLSADATPRQIERLLALGAAHYLTKPFEVTGLLNVLDDLLQNTSPAIV